MFIEAKIYNQLIGVLYFDKNTKRILFEYDKDFIKKGLEISPILMPLSQRNKIYSFDRLNEETFKSLPPVFADSLPDKFGNTILNEWLSIKGKSITDLNPLERLSYIGERGMGALEYFPNLNLKSSETKIEVSDIVEIAKMVLSNKKTNTNSLENILQIGTSAGGARAKAIIAINHKTNEVISGDILVENTDFRYYILKIDGIIDEQTGLPKGYGKIEYAYYKMAKLAGIDMMPSDLYVENNNSHFITERYDRINQEKIHTQTLCGIANMDYNNPVQHSYEQCFDVMRKLNLNHTDFVKQYRRMVFNVLAKNCDDHTKNISFLMNKNGEWKLSPAYDVTFAHNPENYWIKQHQMSVNGKRNNITLEDLDIVGEKHGIRNRKGILKEVQQSVLQWETIAKEVGIEKKRIDYIGGLISSKN